MAKIIVTFTFSLLTFATISLSVAYEDCNAIYVQGEQGESPGKCTTFQECPILDKIIKSPFKTISEVKLLQKLTCKPDNDNPLVCCAIEDIVSVVNNSYYEIDRKPPNKNQVDQSNDGIFFGSDWKRPPIKSPSSTEKSEQVANRIHSNFNLLPSLLVCSNSIANSDRIIGGNETSILEYPWMARIGYWSFAEEKIKYLCAGTVINKRYILTAAHCQQEIDPDEFEPVHVRLGERDKTCHVDYGCSTPLDLKIEKIIPHPDYSKRDKSNDIGLIRVAEDIPLDTLFIKPVCLPFIEEYGLSKDIVDPNLEKYADNGKDEAVVAGWGKTQWTHQEGSKTLLDVALPIVSQKQCQRNYRNITKITITEKQLCAGGVRGKDSCGGDSGGGLFVMQRDIPVLAKTKKMKIFQFAVVSFGPTHCASGGLPGVYSNVYAYKNWILDQLKP